MEWMHGGGRDPNGRSLDDEIRIGKEDWMERQRVAQQPVEQAPWDKPEIPWWEEKHEPAPWDAKEGGPAQLVQPGPGRQGYNGKEDFIRNPEGKNQWTELMRTDAEIQKILNNPKYEGWTKKDFRGETKKNKIKILAKTETDRDQD